MYLHLHLLPTRQLICRPKTNANTGYAHFSDPSRKHFPLHRDDEIPGAASHTVRSTTGERPVSPETQREIGGVERAEAPYSLSGMAVRSGENLVALLPRHATLRFCAGFAATGETGSATA